MECLQLLPGQTVPPLLCQLFAWVMSAGVWAQANITWTIAAVGSLAFFFTLWVHWRLPPTPVCIPQSPQERAEMLLRDSISPQAYKHLLNVGYLEIPSRLYSNRYYRIPRERRRVQVYEVCETAAGLQHQKLGELCVIACEPMPDADLVLTHKWLIEADEQKYLNTANWVR